MLLRLFAEGDISQPCRRLSRIAIDADGAYCGGFYGGLSAAEHMGWATCYA